MTTQTWKILTTPHSITFDSPFGLAVFGFRDSTKEQMADDHPELSFCFIKQIHSNIIVPANLNPLPEADGHHTANMNQALMIQTADCLPVMLLSPDFATALHAGWRGVELNIIGEGAKVHKTKTQSWNSTWAIIGPHISRPSFEVGLDIAERLEHSYRGAGGQTINDVVIDHEDPTKKYVDLFKLAKQQLLFAGIPPEHILHVNRDTFSDNAMASFRREKSPCRQWSFCALKNQT